MSRFVNPRPQFFDADGEPLVLGKLFVFEPGTVTPKDTFTDVNETTSNSNPVLLDGSGRAPNIFYGGSARLVLTAEDDTQIWDVDPVGADALVGPFSTWIPQFTYSVGDIVVASDGLIYRSIVNGNQNNDPPTSPQAWENIEFIQIWNPNVIYPLGATVRASDFLFYRSLINNNQGNDPVTSPNEWGDVVDITAFWSAARFVSDTDSPVTAVNTDRINVDVSVGACEVILPLAPADGYRVRIADILRNSVTNNITVNRNGNTIDSNAENFIIDLNGLSLDFEFDAAANTWRLS